MIPNIEDLTEPPIETAMRTHKCNEREIIRDVIEGLLEIDSSGQIWKLARRRPHLNRRPQRGLATRRHRAEEMTHNGYLRVSSCRNGRRVKALAHRLVWQFFFGDIPEHLCINHKNGDKTDNSPANLEVVSYSENSAHAHANGLIDQRGERNPGAKYTDELVATIRRDHAQGGTTKAAVARQHGVPAHYVSKIVRNERRKPGGDR